MPISVNHPIKRLTEQEFHDVDYQVMNLAFEAQNQLGRFYNENIYQNKLIELCQRDGIDVATEVGIKLSYGSFKKNLFIDLVIESGSIYELKATKSIDASHRVQIMGYLFLSGTQHGKIINFRLPSVEHEFISTSLTQTDRRNISIFNKDGDDKTIAAKKLQSIVIDLLNDWGSFLDTDLYKEAICHLYEIGTDIMHPVEIKNGTVVLGRQTLPLISPEETFCITSMRNGIPTYQTHLQRFLKHTALKKLHWININNLNIEFKTLLN